MIKFENVNVTMQGKRILSDINLEIQDGEFVLICGESGCGKTTMTKLINGLIPHFVRDVSVDGTITVCGKNVSEMPMYEIAELVVDAPAVIPTQLTDCSECTSKSSSVCI